MGTISDSDRWEEQKRKDRRIFKWLYVAAVIVVTIMLTVDILLFWMWIMGTVATVLVLFSSQGMWSARKGPH